MGIESEMGEEIGVAQDDIDELQKTSNFHDQRLTNLELYGSNFVKYDGNYYATLDFCSPLAPVEGCIRQCSDAYKAIPPGWMIAEFTSAVVLNVVEKYTFGTTCLVFTNGLAYYTNTLPRDKGTSCGDNKLSNSSDKTQFKWNSSEGSCTGKILIMLENP